MVRKNRIGVEPEREKSPIPESLQIGGVLISGGSIKRVMTTTDS